MSRVINTAFVRKRRQDLGLTQADVAEEIGVERATVSLWEKGHTAEPRFSFGLAWARVLDLDPEDLLTDEPREVAS